ncbi:MAG: hypothetical protein AAF922_13975 [Pseudomonadota bacterium]
MLKKAETISGTIRPENCEKRWRGLRAYLVFFAIGASHATSSEQPLSAIDWLKDPVPIQLSDPINAALPSLSHNSSDQIAGAVVPQINVSPLGQPDANAAGLLPQNTTGLPTTLWKESTTETLVALMRRLPPDPLPALQSLYYTLLLAEAEPPTDTRAEPVFLSARLDALRRLGAVDPALALADQAGALDQTVFDQWFDLSLLAGTEDDACAALGLRPELTQSYATRVFCLARNGDWTTAALTLQTARALGAVEPQIADLLEAFLDPELVGEFPETVPSAASMTPLLFRLHEAVGIPLPTGNLPREYAMADLRGFSGWKAEIEAAERLTHSGALPANVLLGYYTAQSPAASGGVWSRAAGVQALERALIERDSGAVAEILPPLWQKMRQTGLAVTFSALFAEQLVALPLDIATQRLAFRIALLSPSFARLAPELAGSRESDLFLASVAAGAPDPELARSPGQKAVVQGFAANGASRDHADLLDAGRLGQAILLAALQLDSAGVNTTRDISAGLATLRALGLEETARKTALEILLLRSGT